MRPPAALCATWFPITSFNCFRLPPWSRHSFDADCGRRQNTRKSSPPFKVPNPEDVARHAVRGPTGDVVGAGERLLGYRPEPKVFSHIQHRGPMSPCGCRSTNGPLGRRAVLFCGPEKRAASNPGNRHSVSAITVRIVSEEQDRGIAKQSSVTIVSPPPRRGHCP